MGEKLRVPRNAGHEIEGVEKRFRWAFSTILYLGVIIVVLSGFILWHWRHFSPLQLAATLVLLLSSLVVVCYAFDSLHRTAHTIRERLEQLTFIDEMTGVHNYRYLELRLREELERARRYGRPAALLYLDLDRFKLVNDRLGHQVGNSVLREIAQLLKRSVRACDIVGRAGGDEFLVILPDTDAGRAAKLAERLVSAVKDYSHVTATGQEIDFVTLKVGVAAYPENGEGIDDVIRAADTAALDAKEQGGNCVRVAAGVQT